MRYYDKKEEKKNLCFLYSLVAKILRQKLEWKKILSTYTHARAYTHAYMLT